MSETIIQGKGPGGSPVPLSVDASGNVNTNASLSASSLAINDGTQTSQKLAVDASGKIGINALPALPAGTNVVGHVIVDSAGNVAITTLPALPAGTNVIGHVIVDSASNVTITTLPTLPAGSNNIGGVEIFDSGGTNKLAVDASGRLTILSIANALPAGANVIGQVTANAGTNLNTSSLALESGGNLASIKTDADSIVTNTSNTATNTSNISTVEGATTDAAVVGDNAGSLSAKLRGLTKILNDIWDSTNHLFHSDIKQFGGNAIVTGTGAGGSGIPRVTVSNDSNVLSTQSGTWTVQPGNTPNSTAWLVQDVAGTSGGSTLYHLISAATNNATSLKASAGMLYGGSISNTNAAARFVKFYNKASAPAPATDNALILWTVQIPANATVVLAVPEGAVFGTGIAFAAVANMSDTDNTSIGAGDLSIDLRYK